MQKKILKTIIVIIPWDLLMFYEILLSLEVKRCGIVTYKKGIYQVPQELLNDWINSNWGYYETSGKCVNLKDGYPRAQCSCKNENFVDTVKQFLKTGKLSFPVVHYFSWKLELVSNKLWIIVPENIFLILNRLRTPSNLT